MAKFKVRWEHGGLAGKVAREKVVEEKGSRYAVDHKIRGDIAAALGNLVISRTVGTWRGGAHNAGQTDVPSETPGVRNAKFEIKRPIRSRSFRHLRSTTWPVTAS